MKGTLNLRSNELEGGHLGPAAAAGLGAQESMGRDSHKGEETSEVIGDIQFNLMHRNGRKETLRGSEQSAAPVNDAVERHPGTRTSIVADAPKRQAAPLYSDSWLVCKLSARCDRRRGPTYPP